MPNQASGFADLDLPKPLLEVLAEVGYEAPSPIQQQAIPVLMSGADLLGRAPTGTGKTAAFALPLISRTDVSNPQVQTLTLTPTRELALQVAEAFQTYSKFLPDFRVLPIYGGQDYKPQLQKLKRGVHAVVGTPGRVMDHLRRGTLVLDSLQAIVLDEADEMLRMGFVDEVEWILEQAPKQRQMALFSATMPSEIRRIARRHMRDAQEVSIKAKTATADTIRQRYWITSGTHKLDALTRLLEVEETDGVLIFVRTKSSTAELAGRLEARGYAVAALNGDMPQRAREQTVDKLKRGKLDVLVATDVAARGLDVDRISHVINYDIPYDVESYIHRIGRTGRAGRTGQALLFVSPRERRMLAAIEKATRQKMERLELPTTEVVNNKRIADFKQRITDTRTTGELAFMRTVLEQYQQEHDVPALEIAAALAQIAIGDTPLLVQEESGKKQQHKTDRQRERADAFDKPRRPRTRAASNTDPDTEKFRLEVGLADGVKAGNIVGAIANEAGLDASNIGRVEILEHHSFVDLPIGMPAEIFADLKKAWVCGKTLNLSRVNEPSKQQQKKRAKPSKKTNAKDNKPNKKRAAGAKRKKSSSPKRSTAGDNPNARKPRKRKK